MNYPDEQILKPMYSITSEQSIIGIILLDAAKASYELDAIAPTHFYDPAHQIIMTAYFSLFNDSKQIDVSLLTTKLEETGEIDRIGGIEYLVEMARNVGSTGNMAGHVRVVLNKFKERSLLAAGQELQNIMYKNGLNTEERVAEAEVLMEEAFEAGDATVEVEGMNTAGKEFYIKLQERYESDGILGVTFGLRDLDNRLQGLKAGELYIVAGLPGCGKTTVMTKVCTSAHQSGFKGYVASLEMPRAQIFERLVAQLGGVNLADLKTGDAIDSNPQGLTVGMHRAKELNLVIDDKPGLDIADLKARCWKQKRKHGLDYLIVDYLQLLTDRSVKGPRLEVVSSISRKLKALSKELKIPVIALAQLNREVLKRDNKRANASDIRESGQIEQDADVIIMLYRDESHNPETMNKGVIELGVVKFRDGVPGTDYANFVGAKNQILDLQEGFCFIQPEAKPTYDKSRYK